MILHFSVAICAGVSQQHLGALVFQVVELDEKLLDLVLLGEVEQIESVAVVRVVHS